MYSPTQVEVPIAGLFLDLGMHRSSLLAYLLADPGLSLRSILVSGRILGGKKTAAYVILVAVFRTVARYVFDPILSMTKGFAGGKPGRGYPSQVEVLVERGPYGLCEIAQEKFGYRPLGEGYAGKCHLCVDVRRHLVGREDFPELQPRGFYEQI